MTHAANSFTESSLWSPISRCLVKVRAGKYSHLLGLLLASAILLVIWSLAVPVFECPDEPHHWQYARYLHDHLSLPIYGPKFMEANSPPLYYLLIAPVAAASEVPKQIGHWDAQGTLQTPSPPSLFENSRADLRSLRFLPLRLARLLTVALSVLAVFFCYLSGLEATGDRLTGLLAGSLMAFLPQFTFRGMNISNDALVTLMSTVSVYLIIRLIRRGFTWPLGLVAAACIGLALLSKPTSLFLPAPLGLAILSERVPWRIRLVRLGVLGLTLAIAFPWLVRNQVLYGDPLASQAMLTAVRVLVDQKPLSSPYFTSTFPALLARSFVGVFGWMNVWLPQTLYRSYALPAVLAGVGYLCRTLRRMLDIRLALVLATVPLLNLLVVIYINLTFSQPQGRYMFPALSSLAVLTAVGLEGLPHWRRTATCLLAGVLLGINICVLVFIILPAYWPLPS